MTDAAHPQLADDPAAEPAPANAEPATAKNPFPTSMTVPGVNGEDVVVDLAVVDGVVYAPTLDRLFLAPDVRQYVTQYCAAWSSSVVTTQNLAGRLAELPRRAQLIFRESQLHAMLGLAADERLVRTVTDDVAGTVRFIVESPRLAPMPLPDGGPPVISLPVAAWYEHRRSAQ